MRYCVPLYQYRFPMYIMNPKQSTLNSFDSCSLRSGVFFIYPVNKLTDSQYYTQLYNWLAIYFLLIFNITLNQNITSLDHIRICFPKFVHYSYENQTHSYLPVLFRMKFSNTQSSNILYAIPRLEIPHTYPHAISSNRIKRVLQLVTNMTPNCMTRPVGILGL